MVEFGLEHLITFLVGGGGGGGILHIFYKRQIQVTDRYLERMEERLDDHKVMFDRLHEKDDAKDNKLIDFIKLQLEIERRDKDEIIRQLREVCRNTNGTEVALSEMVRRIYDGTAPSQGKKVRVANKNT